MLNARTQYLLDPPWNYKGTLIAKNQTEKISYIQEKIPSYSPQEVYSAICGIDNHATQNNGCLDNLSFQEGVKGPSGASHFHTDSPMLEFDSVTSVSAQLVRITDGKYNIYVNF